MPRERIVKYPPKPGRLKRSEVKSVVARVVHQKNVFEKIQKILVPLKVRATDNGDGTYGAEVDGHIKHIETHADRIRYALQNRLEGNVRVEFPKLGHRDGVNTFTFTVAPPIL